jgi:hypothetical protein
MARRRQPQPRPCQTNELVSLALALSRRTPVLQSVPNKKMPQMCCCPMFSSPNNMHCSKCAGNGESMPGTGDVYLESKAVIGAA